MTDAMGRVTAYNYLDNGLVSQVVAAPSDWSTSFTVDAYSYDGAGNVTEKWTNNWTTDTTYQVDAAGRVTQETTDPSGLDRTTGISYTPDDKQASVTRGGPDGVSQTTSYTYDPAGNVLSRSVADPGSGGPVAWFNLSQSSGTAVPDWITGGPGAVASGVTWDSSEGTFSGTAGSQVSTAGPAVDTTGSFTVAAWVNVTAPGTGNQAIVSQAAGTQNGFELRYNPATGNFELARPLTDTSGAAVAVAGSGPSATAATGAWMFVAGTYDAAAGTMTLYVNGSPAGTATDTTPVAADGAFTVGSAKTGGAQGDWFDGQAADVQVYPRALSAGEVGQLWGISGDITTSTLTTTWTRDQRGLPVTMTSPDGEVTRYDYDEAGRLAVTTMPGVAAEKYGSPVAAANPVASTGYDTFGDTTETSDPDGVVTTIGYDGDGRKVTQAMPRYTPPDGSPAIAAATAVTAYDGDGLVTSVTDPLGNQTEYAYDQLGDRVLVTAPDTSTTATAYDDNGEPLQVTGPTGAVTDTTWDYLGRKATSTQVERDTGAGTAAYTTSYTYNDGAGGWLSHQASPDGVTRDIAYNAAGQVTAVADGQGDTTSYQYDSLGRRTETNYPGGSYATTGYDPLGDVTSTKRYDAGDNLLASTSAAFDGEGRRVSATDADGNSTTFTYDQTGLLTAEVQPVTATSGISISFGYDASGNQVRYTDGNGGDWYNTYNSWGLQESRIEPATSHYSSPADSAFTTSYDADGRPVTLAEPGGATVTSSYNNLSELTGQSGAGADAATPDRTFTYDPAGDLQSASTTGAGSAGATSESFTYDDRGQVMTASGSAGAASYTYNGDGQVASVTDAAGMTSYSYDNVGRLATLADPATGVTASYSYNPDSQVSGVSYGTGNDTRSLAYDGQRRLASDTLKTSSGTVVASQSYGYDPAGHLTSQTATGLAGPASSTYTYDQAGRLATWNNGTTTVYGYDGNGNLTTDGAKTLTYDPRNELTGDGSGTYSYTARGTPVSEPGPSGSLTVSFDAYGDQATAGTSGYTYDALGRLTATTPATGTGQQLSYAGDTGTIASDGTTAYTWDPAGTSLFAAGNPGGGGGSLVLANAHGDVTGQFSPAATTLTASRAYDPWGTVTSGTLAGSLGYQSALTDPATGKDLMGARWYSPGTGGFTSADTIPQPPVPGPAAGNPYAYAGDDPLDASDPSGHGDPGSALLERGVAAAEDGTAAAAKFEGATAPEEVVCGPECEALGAALAVSFGLGDAVGALIFGPSGGGTAFDVSGLLNGLTANYDASQSGQVVVSGVHATVPFIDPGYATVPVAPNDGPKGTSKPSVTKTGNNGTTKTTSKPKPKLVITEPGPSKPATNPNGALQTPGAGIARIRQQIAALAAAGIGGNNGGAGTPPASASAGGCQPGGSGSGSGVPDPFSFLLNLLSPGSTAQGSNQNNPLAGGQSFTPGTRVLLPGGKTAPISSLKPGDKVTARDTRTGKDQTETVTAVEVHHDTDLYDLKVKTGNGTEVIHTTSSHLFYDPSLNSWIPANHLKKGEHLKAPDGQNAVADGGSVPADHDGWMWDLTVQDDHDFYVLPAQESGRYAHDNAVGSAPILVHNVNPKLGCYDGAPGTNYGPADNPTRVSGPWAKSDIWRGTRGLRPYRLGDRLQIHHADQMPGSPIHELDQNFHLNADIHRNPFNQGVDSLMRRQDTQLHWWYRSMEQGWGSAYGPGAWFENWPSSAGP